MTDAEVQSGVEMWRNILRDLWKVVQRYPILLVWPVTLYMRFFERETLDRWVAAALETDES